MGNFPYIFGAVYLFQNLNIFMTWKINFKQPCAKCEHMKKTQRIYPYSCIHMVGLYGTFFFCFFTAPFQLGKRNWESNEHTLII